MYLDMNMLRKLPFLQMFMPKRKRNGSLWASLIGIGLTAAVFGLARGNRKDVALPVSDAIKNFTPKMNFQGMNNIVKNIAPNLNLDRMDNAALAEFSEELLESALNKEKSSTGESAKSEHKA
jgi:hypothetical protein